MIKRTFGDVKAELARVAGQTGLQVTDARLRELLDLAQERLCTLGEWPYQYARLKFRQYGGIVSLPTDFEAIVHSNLDNAPIDVQPPWYEFLEYGPGPQDEKNFSNSGIDLGESPVYRQPGLDGALLTVTSTNGDDDGTVKIVGYDTDGLRQEVDAALPQTKSTVLWSKISQVVKPVTLGDVVLSFTDTFGEDFVAASYRPRDRNPTFRTYRFPIGEAEEKLVHTICRRRLFPVTGDADELFITNLNALRLAVKGIALEDKGDLSGSNACFDLAKGILQGESKLYKAGRTMAPVNVSKVGALSTRPDIY